MNTMAALFPLQAKLENWRQNGNLPYVKSIRLAHPGTDLERGRQALSHGVLYVYPSGGRIHDVAGRGKAVSLQKGIALTYCVGLKTAADETALRQVGETEATLIRNLYGLKLPHVEHERGKTIIGTFEIDHDMRELYQDGFYFTSLRVLTHLKILQEN